MIDQFVMEHPDTPISRIKKDPDVMSRLHETAERVKIALTNDQQPYDIFIPSVYNKDLTCKLSKERFESLTSKLLTRLLIPIRRWH